ncbi:MAG TPA: GNAT family N-acetyltransferase [Candidatus Dormibacteraeota bacterium]|nr:GNAT family N-acetyltransferase [Candidatus Dormibacteraeota bacterium]
MIRRFRLGDEIALARVFQRSVSSIAPTKYRDDQVAAWLQSGPTSDELRDRMRSREAFVAEDDGVLVGWIDLLPSGHIDMLYCIPERSRGGIADMLYVEVEKRARAMGISRLHSEASIFAEAFFKRHGWRVDERELVVRLGVTIARARMSVALER